MKIENEQFMILGCARSGIALAKFIIERKGKVTLCDNKEYEALVKTGYGIEHLKDEPSVRFIFGRNPNEEEVKGAKLLILSPGIPPWAEGVKLANKNNIPLISEMEFANLFCKGNIVAITGTNGKTTTTTLTGQLFSNADYETYVGGNIGDAYINYADKGDENSVYVLEVSSYQLEMAKELKPKISVITNITPDHLDRHKTMENYISVKGNIFMNQDENDTLIANFDDKLVYDLSKKAKCKVRYFTLTDNENCAAYLKENMIYLNIDAETTSLIDINELKLYGLHNVANVMAASLCAYIYGVNIDSIRSTLKNFRAVEHRIEFVDTVDNIDYINDSKGTNTDATIIAINAMSKPINLILGGYDKGGEFDELMDEVKRKVKRIAVIGATRQKIINCAVQKRYTEYTVCDSLEEAIETLRNKAEEGEVILLSPACASWDMFKDFEKRGRDFKDYVKKIKEGN